MDVTIGDRRDHEAVEPELFVGLPDLGGGPGRDDVTVLDDDAGVVDEPSRSEPRERGSERRRVTRRPRRRATP